MKYLFPLVLVPMLTGCLATAGDLQEVSMSLARLGEAQSQLQQGAISQQTYAEKLNAEIQVTADVANRAFERGADLVGVISSNPVESIAAILGLIATSVATTNRIRDQRRIARNEPTGITPPRTPSSG